ncbi:MAG: hypothetical protein JO115_25595 [Pseudonocardiales bacterium]|nr:hypothetical protein [Pseudonocardiales bacterium]
MGGYDRGGDHSCGCYYGKYGYYDDYGRYSSVYYYNGYNYGGYTYYGHDRGLGKL